MKMHVSKRMFIVDDDPFWAAMLTQLLNDLGYFNVLSFNNGRDCIKYLSLNPCIVFLDYQMDDINGLEVLQQIKQNHPTTGVLMCTANEDLSVAVNAMKYGSYDYLLKRNASSKEIAALIDAMTELSLVEEIY